MILRDVMRRRGFALIATVVVALVLAPCQIRPQIQKEASKAVTNEMAPDRAFLEWLDALRAEARRRGISESTLNAALNDITSSSGRLWYFLKIKSFNRCHGINLG